MSVVVSRALLHLLFLPLDRDEAVHPGGLRGDAVLGQDPLRVGRRRRRRHHRRRRELELVGKGAVS